MNLHVLVGTCLDMYQPHSQNSHSAGSERMESTMAYGSTMNTRDLELRSVIKFLTKKGKKPKEIHKRMNVVYGDVSTSFCQVRFWSKQFKWGRELIEDDSRSGRPVEASSKEMCQKVEDMILQDRRVKVSVRPVTHELGISTGTVSSTIHSVVMISEVSSRWMPRMLTP